MEWLALLGETAVARALVRSPTLYIFANAAHILSIGVLVGTILVLDLRILGLLKALPLAPVARTLSRLAGIGLGVTLLTGFLLFAVRPLDYLENTAFLAKLAIICLGFINVVAVHRSHAWGDVLDGAEPAAGLRLSAALSLVIWISAIVAGRWIGFL